MPKNSKLCFGHPPAPSRKEKLFLENLLETFSGSAHVPVVEA